MLCCITINPFWVQRVYLPVCPLGTHPLAAVPGEPGSDRQLLPRQGLPRPAAGNSRQLAPVGAYTTVEHMQRL
ncbi:hypothetical protein OEZ85_013423 [Tetradesmus obliquus]|uniref:Uncharacterized protein n=1 Tax=Tetradesmus obliquus TaxID=3088 RepID=A0ABY8U6N9_TETOB|nr:hypothetical protein OEZ85_013423 [Tetradesmus obliquus]